MPAWRRTSPSAQAARITPRPGGWVGGPTAILAWLGAPCGGADPRVRVRPVALDAGADRPRRADPLCPATREPVRRRNANRDFAGTPRHRSPDPAARSAARRRPRRRRGRRTVRHLSGHFREFQPRLSACKANWRRPGSGSERTRCCVSFATRRERSAFGFGEPDSRAPSSGPTSSTSWPARQTPTGLSG